MNLNDLPYIMARCLILTIIIEVGIAIMLGYRKKDLINILLVNIMTNPIVVTVPLYFNVKYGLLERNIVLLILELLTVFIEGFIYKKYLSKRKINPYILSLILNASSYLVGVVINYL
jgi:hypothetical protein